MKHYLSKTKKLVILTIGIFVLSLSANSVNAGTRSFPDGTANCTSDNPTRVYTCTFLGSDVPNDMYDANGNVEVSFEAWGGGGGSAPVLSCANGLTSTDGGGGAAYAQKTLPTVQKIDSFIFKIGFGGPKGSKGTKSEGLLNNSSFITANEGGITTGGAGGVGDVVKSGGNGGKGFINTCPTTEGGGGGGGSAGGPYANGTKGEDGTGTNGGLGGKIDIGGGNGGNGGIHKLDGNGAVITNGSGGRGLTPGGGGGGNAGKTSNRPCDNDPDGTGCGAVGGITIAWGTTITVIKKSNDAATFDFTVTGKSATKNASLTTTPVVGTGTFLKKEVIPWPNKPGTVDVTEKLPTIDWTLSGATCTSGGTPNLQGLGVFGVNILLGKNIDCTFVDNTKNFPPISPSPSVPPISPSPSVSPSPSPSPSLSPSPSVSPSPSPSPSPSVSPSPSPTPSGCNPSNGVDECSKTVPCPGGQGCYTPTCTCVSFCPASKSGPTHGNLKQQ